MLALALASFLSFQMAKLKANILFKWFQLPSDLVQMIIRNQIQMLRTNVLRYLRVEILWKHEITETSCVRRPPSYSVGLLTQQRELSFFQACLSMADFGSSRSPPLCSSYYTHRQKNLVPHLHLTNVPYPLSQLQQSGSIRLVSQSTLHPLQSIKTQFVYKYLV